MYLWQNALNLLEKCFFFRITKKTETANMSGTNSWNTQTYDRHTRHFLIIRDRLVSVMNTYGLMSSKEEGRLLAVPLLLVGAGPVAFGVNVN